MVIDALKGILSVIMNGHSKKMLLMKSLNTLDGIFYVDAKDEATRKSHLDSEKRFLNKEHHIRRKILKD